MAKQLFDEETKNWIINSYNSGKTQKAIVEEVKCSPSTLRKYLKEWGVHKAAKNVVKDNEKLIIRLYKEGMSQVDIANKLGTYNTSIRRVLQRNNIQLRDISKVTRLCKHNPFKRNDEYSDYFLGLLMTDGTITKNSKENRNYSIVLSLNEDDAYLVKTFRDWASPDTKLSRIYQKINGSYMVSCNFSNEETVDWLRRKGNFYNKSYNAKLYVPLNYNILRGIFDGDGGYHLVGNSLQFFVCGASLTFMTQIYNFLKKNKFNVHMHNRPRNKDKDFYYVEIYAQDDVLRLGQLLYNNAHIYMQRKYDKWLAFYESKMNKHTLNSGNGMATQS